VKLTADGWAQAQESGRKLRSLLRPDDTLHFFTSPYRRTRETTEGILSTLTADSPAPSPFPRQTIKVFEEPRLREQDFGNFQPAGAAMARMWRERAAYGHFFYRIPDGESAADAYDRVSGFNESLWRSFGDEDFASVCVLVTHGLMARVFLMKWYHWSVEYFEDLRNVNHCEFVVMKRSGADEGGRGGRYVLQNRMRTWTEWRKERLEEEERQKGDAGGAAGEGGRGSPVPVRKKWNAKTAADEEQRKGAPRRQNTIDLFRDDLEESRAEQSKEEADDPRGRAAPPAEGQATSTMDWAGLSPGQRRSNRVAVLRQGRDGGGTQSGASSDDDSTERDESPPAATAPRSLALAMSGRLGNGGGGGNGSGSRSGGEGPSDGRMDMTAMADSLGDQSDMEEEDDDHREEIEKNFERIQQEESGFLGSVR